MSAACMHGPIRLVRSSAIDGCENMAPIFEWAEGDAYVSIDRVRYRGRTGAILVYNNPPVHQVATPGLHALLDGLDATLRDADRLEYLILYDSNDPLHAGGDLKESLRNLQSTLEAKKVKESEGAPAEEIDRLFSWGEARLKKGITLHAKIRTLADSMRVAAVCGGGLRFGGSAEIPLMADTLVGDGRGGMCFSESMIGIIPGWAGIARVLIKSGYVNAEYMAKTAREVSARRLREIGIYDEVVEVPFPLPKMKRTGRPEEDRRNYRTELDEHNDKTGLILLPRALEQVLSSSAVEKKEKRRLADRAEIEQEVERRADPYQYAHIWKRPLKEVKEEVARLGRPLAPQSIAALDSLLEGYDPSSFDERRFAKEELEADAALYRDPRFLEGLSAMLDQRVPDFRNPAEREDADAEWSARWTLAN